jgi:tryptophanyl-tRNA synthetase
MAVAVEPSIRNRRAEFAQDLNYVLEVIREGTEMVRERTEATKRDVVSRLGLFQI